MSTALATRNTTTDLTITPDQTAFTQAQEAALRQLGVQANSPADVAVFFHQAKRTGLDPFNREIYMITRQGKATIQTGIDGFYKIADRSVRAEGGSWGIPETLWCGEDGKWTDVWLSKRAPAAAKVTVERNGSRFTTVAITDEYKAKGPMWDKMPARMIAKCAEALAIRRAFPDALSGLYTSEEMQQADAPAQHQPAPSAGGARLEQARQRPQSRPAQSAHSPAEHQEPMCTPQVWANVQAAMANQGITDPAQIGETVENIVGRPITGPGAMTLAEAHLIVEKMTPPAPAAEPEQDILPEPEA
jgi:phage recombination protein Bet